MTVGTFTTPNFPTQDPATYKRNIDASFSAAKRFIDAFAPHAQTTPNLTVAVDPGFIFNGGTLTEVSTQNTSAVVASSRAGITRIDRVVGDNLTGVVSVLTGTSVAPALTAGKFPIAQIALTTSSTAITNAMITDERAFPSGRGIDYQVFTSTGAFSWAKPLVFSTLATVLVMQWAPGGGGSTASPGSGGGGGACLVYQAPITSFSTAVSGNIGAGSTAGAAASNVTVFNGTTVYSGGIGILSGCGGGGIFSQGSTATNGGGSPAGGAAGSSAGVDGGDSAYGGGGGGQTSNADGGKSVYGGGGGGSAAGGDGGRSLYGGGGGGGNAGVGGASVFGGNGGADGVAGSAPGGAGGRNASGARGEVRVWVFP